MKIQRSVTRFKIGSRATTAPSESGRGLVWGLLDLLLDRRIARHRMAA